MEFVNHEASLLLRDKFVVVLGDSIQRSVYKDIVLLLQKDKYLSLAQLKSKGESSFEQDRLLEGGPLHNGPTYREVREYRSHRHLVRFYFLTRIYSPYMQWILEHFRRHLKPDVVIVNSCLWDITRYNANWLEEYTVNLDRFFHGLREVLPMETLVMWNLTLPVSQRIKGGFLPPQMVYKALQLNQDVITANRLSLEWAIAYHVAVLDLYSRFRLNLQQRMGDGVHWDAQAHRTITSLILQRTAQAWGRFATADDFSSLGGIHGYGFHGNAGPPDLGPSGFSSFPISAGAEAYRSHYLDCEEFTEDSVTANYQFIQGYVSFDRDEQLPPPHPTHHRPAHGMAAMHGVRYRPYSLPPHITSASQEGQNQRYHSYVTRKRLTKRH